jgi:tRNA-dihydrouridine synthase
MTVAECLAALKQQVKLSVDRIGEYRGILHIRRHLAATPVFKGIPNFRETRIAMLRAENVTDLYALMDQAAERAASLRAE